MHTRLCEDHRSLLREKCPTQTEALLKFITIVAPNIFYFNHPTVCASVRARVVLGASPHRRLCEERPRLPWACSRRPHHRAPGPVRSPGGACKDSKMAFSSKMWSKKCEKRPCEHQGWEGEGRKCSGEGISYGTRERSVAEPGKWGSQEGGILIFVSQHPAPF